MNNFVEKCRCKINHNRDRKSNRTTTVEDKEKIVLRIPNKISTRTRKFQGNSTKLFTDKIILV